jgi:hypothetical protein
MFESRLWRKFLGILAFCLSLSILGCYGTSGSAGVDWGRNTQPNSPPPPPPDRDHQFDAQKNGPPPHAPAYGYRAKYQYRYYPDESVYFDIHRGIYFHLNRGEWTMSVSLPGSIRLGNDYVTLELETDKPYLDNNEHQKKYPPGKLKNKGNKHM